MRHCETVPAITSAGAHGLPSGPKLGRLLFGVPRPHARRCDETRRHWSAVSATGVSSLSWARVVRYRRNLIGHYHVRTKRQALRFVEALGFCYAFTPGPGGLPGLFDVLATRSIDRMWSWAWQWKDELATERKVFYGKVLRRKPTYISVAYLPHFYALSGNVGEPDDYLQAYRAGGLSLLAKDLYEYVRDHGPCSTWVLRKQFVGLQARGGAFHRALGDLQGRFLIAKVGESEGGSYSFIWDLFDRWFPQVQHHAGKITTEEAAAAVLERYLRTIGAAAAAPTAALFGWSRMLFVTARNQIVEHVLDADIAGTPVLVHGDLARSSTKPRRRGAGAG